MSGVRRPPRSRRAGRIVGVRRMSAGGDEMQGHATWRQVIAGVLAPRGVRVGTDAGRTWAAEGHGRRLIFCTRNRTDPILGFAKNGDAPDFSRRSASIPPVGVGRNRAASPSSSHGTDAFNNKVRIGTTTGPGLKGHKGSEPFTADAFKALIRFRPFSPTNVHRVQPGSVLHRMHRPW